MKPLGHITLGTRRIATRARKVIEHSGQAAIYVGSTGEAAAVEHYAADYRTALKRHACHLVGVYRCEPGQQDLVHDLTRDLSEHIKSQRLVPACQQ